MDPAFLIAKDLSPDEKSVFMAQYSSRKKSVAVGVLLACLGIFCWLPGMHKFYTGQIGIGVLYLAGWVLSFILVSVYIGFVGLFFIWAISIIDAFLMGPTIAARNQQIANEIKSEISFMKS